MKKFIRSLLFLITSLARLINIGLFSYIKFQEWLCKHLDIKLVARLYNLEPYEKVDPADKTNFLLKEGFNVSYMEMITRPEAGGHWYHWVPFRKWLSESCIDLNQAGIRINAFGFRGKEIMFNKAQDTTRIMCIGDSCTFGISENLSYPSAVERKLNEAGNKVEVINAGIEKYSSRNILKRLDYYLGFKPDIVTIYTGWFGFNSFGDDFTDINHIFSNVYPLMKIRVSLHNLFSNNKTELPSAIHNKYYQAVKSDYHPAFMEHIEQIIKTLQSNGVKVVLCTLPSLFDPNNEPDLETIVLGRLPEFCDNAYIYGLRVYKFNEHLRELSGKCDTLIIDLEKYIDSLYPVKKEHFWDSCHLKPDDQQKLGEFIADQLITNKIVY